MRRKKPRVGQRRPAPAGGQRGHLGSRRGDLRTQVRHRVEVDVQGATDAVEAQLRDAAQVSGPIAEGVADAVGTPQVQMGVVLPGDADAAEHLDAVLRVGLGGVDRLRGGDRRGDGQLIGITADGRRRVGGRHRDPPGAQQHLGTKVLDRLEAADRFAELFADLGVPGGGLQCPSGDTGRFGGQQGGGEIVEAASRHRQPESRRTVEGHRRERTGEVGGRQRLDPHARVGRIDQKHALARAEEHQSATVGTQHVVGRTGDQTVPLAQITAQHQADRRSS